MYEHKNGIKYRKIEQVDLSWLLALKNESWWGTHGAPALNHDDQLRWYNNLGHDTLVMIAEADTKISEQEMNNLIHRIGVGIYSNIDWIAHACDLSGSIAKPFRGRPLVKKSFECGLDFGFEMLNMRRIQCEVVEYNLAAQKLEIDHLGFKVEGRRREAVYKAGEYYDSIMLGMTRIDWIESCAKRGHDCCCKNVDHEQNRKNVNRASHLGKMTPIAQ